MRRFVLQHNIERFEHALAQEMDPAERRVIGALLEEARRDLATLDGEDEDAPAQRTSKASHN
ncbi:MAG: hypothetical protein ACTHMG_06870 [Sphingomonas sp.]